MLIRKPPDYHLPEQEVTPESLYLTRRAWIAGATAAGLLPLTACNPETEAEAAPDSNLTKLPYRPGPFATGEDKTPFEAITTYNNFYEFGTDKADPSRHGHRLKPRPWTVAIGGLVDKPQRIDVDALIKSMPLEERIYRLRCVEGWSMVIPWVGFPLAKLLQRVAPKSEARFVEFVTLHDPKQMPGQRWDVLDWPYVEGLRLDEAMHPLTILAVGLYGRVLPNQNGAPIRLVVPWKYGFKSIKSIVAIRLVGRQPQTSWSRMAPHEYGFYSNVNPDVAHPRWSQRTERRIGEFRRRPTQLFNGYGSEVAHLYRGMDLRRFF